ncbi:hypothetical protein SAMN05518845_107134 [Variovorax sp. YR750]|nr:hypothetical protein SAMN05518845_107134 [Variovorax sp. YR750]
MRKWIAPTGFLPQDPAHPSNEHMEATMNTDAVASPALRESPVDSSFLAGNSVLEVLGLVPRPGSFALEALEGLPRHDLGPTQVLCYSGRPVAQVDSYAGARLIDLLDACGLSERPRSELKRCVVVARGDDGYQAIFSWNELYNSTIGEKVLVLYEKNGEALDAHLGTICLISAGDSRLGPRHLRGLRQVAVKML